MPPNLDAYVVSPARNRETIERFLSAYVDRAASEDRGNEELMLVAMDSAGQPSNGDDWEWEPSRSLTHIIERGLQFPSRAFSAYLKPLNSSLAGAILAFDVDNQVIFGISLDDEGAKTENPGASQVLAARNGSNTGRNARFHRGRGTSTAARNAAASSECCL